MDASAYLGRSRLYRRLRNGHHGQLVELFARRLIEEGLVPLGTWRCLNVVDGLLGWMASRRTKLAGLDEGMVERYLRHRGGRQNIQPGDRAALRRWLSVLREAGAIAPAAPPPISQHGRIFMERRKATTITVKLALEWAMLPPDRHATWGLRLSDVRGFARHVSIIDPGTQVPPAGILPAVKRAKPYIYSDTEIEALLAAALALPPKNVLRRWTCHTLLGLIAVTGMRLAEATGLQRDDVDLDKGVLTVRLTKLGKSRLVPVASLHHRSAAQLRRAARCASRIAHRLDLLRHRARRPPAAPVRLPCILASVPRGRAAAPRRSGRAARA